MGLTCSICKNKNCFMINYFSPEEIGLISENKSNIYYTVKNEISAKDIFRKNQFYKPRIP